MATKKTRKSAKKPAKKPAKRGTKRRAKVSADATRSRKIVGSNRDTLIEAGVINPDYVFSAPDSAAIEGLSQQEVNVLIEVYNDLGAPFFEDNSPNGFVF